MVESYMVSQGIKYRIIWLNCIILPHMCSGITRIMERVTEN